MFVGIYPREVIVDAPKELPTIDNIEKLETSQVTNDTQQIKCTTDKQIL